MGTGSAGRATVTGGCGGLFSAAFATLPTAADIVTLPALATLAFFGGLFRLALPALFGFASSLAFFPFSLGGLALGLSAALGLAVLVGGAFVGLVLFRFVGLRPFAALLPLRDLLDVFAALILLALRQLLNALVSLFFRALDSLLNVAAFVFFALGALLRFVRAFVFRALRALLRFVRALVFGTLRALLR
ncbi:MAG: hypothetical protein ACRD3G_20550, partial [Vicinamibacterales bacterium]